MSQVDLMEVIDRYVNLGEADPLEIAKKVEREMGEDALSKELLALSQDIIAEFARKKLGSVRRTAEIALRPGDPQTAANLGIAKAWVPTIGDNPPHWKRASELTAGDLRARGRWYERFAISAAQRAIWCMEVADMIDEEGVLTLGELKAPLPSLPEHDDMPGIDR